jgi:ribonuclease VapC
VAPPVSGGVLDASVVIAAVLDEPGLKDAKVWFTDACVSSVNLTEIISKLIDFGHTPEAAATGLLKFGLEVHPFTHSQAITAGTLRSATRQRGLSLGDRACLALAAELGRPAVTADRAWAELDLGIPIEVIR